MFARKKPDTVKKRKSKRGRLSCPEFPRRKFSFKIYVVFGTFWQPNQKRNVIDDVVVIT